MAETTATKVITKSGETTFAELSEKSEVLAVYFSAHWCPPCRRFTPILADLYNKWNANAGDKKPLEVVFCSFDSDADQYKEYFDTMPWATLPFGDPLIKKLSDKFEVEGIPCLVIISKDGKQEMLSNNGYEDISLKKEKAIDEWKKLY